MNKHHIEKYPFEEIISKYKGNLNIEVETAYIYTYDNEVSINFGDKRYFDIYPNGSYVYYAETLPTTEEIEFINKIILELELENK